MRNRFGVKLVLPENTQFELHVGKSKKVTTSKLLLNGRVVRTIETEDLLVKNVNDGDVIAVTLNSNDEIIDNNGIVFFPIGNMIFSLRTILDVKLENGKVNVYFEDILLDTKEIEDFGDLFTRTPRFNTVKRTSYKAFITDVDEIAIVRYVNTHQHTEYSRLDGMSKISDVANKTEWAGAITDHGVMTGVLKFDSALRNQEKKPLIGMEPYIERINDDIFVNKLVNPKDLSEEDAKAYKRAYYKKDHIIMIAKNNTGYHNLIKLASLSWENFYGKNHIRYEDLMTHSEGIIATTACLGSTIGRSLMEDEKKIREAFFKELGETEQIKKIAIDAGESEIDLLQGDDLDLSVEETELLRNRFGIEKTWLSSDDIKELIKDKTEEFPLTVESFNGYMKTANLYLQKMIAIFGKDDFYVEIQRHKFAAEEYYEKKCLELAEKYGLKIVSGIDSHYVNKEDKETHETWLCEATKSNINDPKRLRFPGEGYYLMTSDEALELFEDLQEALENSLEIADKCNVNLKVKEYFLPKFPLPEGYDEEGTDPAEEQVRYFKYLVSEGYKKRFLESDKYRDSEYIERMKFEIKTILDMKFASYFLIVQDFIAWAKDSNVAENREKYFPKRYYDYDKLPEAVLNKDFEIYVGPGRGSAAGSLVAYCLGITNIDPIEYGLLFERFLNPDRISMPELLGFRCEPLREHASASPPIYSGVSTSKVG